MAKIYDVAKRAGVGVSTVSKVLNHYDNISDETRERVLKAVEELNYVPNPIASALSSKKSNRIAIVIYTGDLPEVDEISLSYLKGATRAARKLGLEPITVLSQSIKSKSAQQIKSYFRSMRIGSIVIFGMRFYDHEFDELIAEEAFQMVLVDVPIYKDKISCIMVDHQKAQGQMTELMIEKYAPQKILYLSGIEGAYVSDQRLSGALGAAKARGVQLDVYEGGFSQQQANQVVQEFGSHYDVIVTASDMMAIGATMALKQMGLDKPVSGFDGVRLVAYVSPEMLSVKQDFDMIAYQAVCESLRLSEPEMYGIQIFVDYQIGSVEPKSLS